MEQDEELEEMLEDIAFDDSNIPGGHRWRKKGAIQGDKFLGRGRKEEIALIQPRYYGDLLAWAVKHYVESEAWEVVEVTSHRLPAPHYTDVKVDHDKQENLLCDGCLLIQRQHTRLVASIRTSATSSALLVVKSLRHDKEEAFTFVEGVDKFIKANNLYRGKKIGFDGHLSFLDPPVKHWQDLILEPQLKDEIIANTVGFLSKKAELLRYGIPARRGVLLIGEPGTGKTLICKILINECKDITCIVADSGALKYTRYIYELYELARDLSPTMVFLEDIDLIGQDRMESHYSRGEALFTLLSMLDGIEECKEIVTVATANCLEVLDKALRQRPSRFDRIIELPLPSLEGRRELVRSLCQKVPLDHNVQEYLAKKTENYTPAQLQEVVYSLVIGHQHSPYCAGTEHCHFSLAEAESVLSKINRKNGHLGFRLPNRDSNAQALKIGPVEFEPRPTSGAVHDFRTV